MLAMKLDPANKIARAAYASAKGVPVEGVTGTGFRLRQRKGGRPRTYTDEEIRAALDAAGGSVRKAARILGSGIGTVDTRAKSLGLKAIKKIDSRSKNSS